MDNMSIYTVYQSAQNISSVLSTFIQNIDKSVAALYIICVMDGEITAAELAVRRRAEDSLVKKFKKTMFSRFAKEIGRASCRERV